MAKQIRDIGASVRARLLALARHRNQQFDLVLTRYALERLLYRLSLTAYRERFVLKGAMLITTWFDDPHRPTRDVDLLGYGDPSPEPMLTVFREICAITADDGLTFDTDALRVDLIREELQYGGLRLRTTAALAGARISVVIDIGFGDAVEPGVEEIDLPVLLDFPAPHLRAYARETVIAEKFQAIVALGRANSRMKDFYDIWILSKTYEFADDRLATAIVATFQRRNTAIPKGALDGLALDFAQDDGKRQQWATFIKDLSGDVPPLATVIKDLAAFLIPKAREALALATNRE
jgi:predicted nucleotidyltransferase component of viral defense system